MSIEQKPIQPESIFARAHINHYNTKSTEEWLQKVSRGWCDAPEDIINERRKQAVEYYFSINERTPEKEAILGCCGTAADSTEKPDADATGTVAAEPKSKPKTQKRKSNKSKK